MRKHAGQVAFPGGAVDNSDATLIAAALREAQEEVAIPPESVEVIGVLPPVDSVTGFQVTPVVGIIPPDLHYHASGMKSLRSSKCRWPKRCGWDAITRWISIAAAIRIASGYLVPALFCLGNDRRYYSRAGAADRRSSLALPAILQVACTLAFLQLEFSGIYLIARVHSISKSAVIH